MTPMKITPFQCYQAERAAHAWLKRVTGRRLRFRPLTVPVPIWATGEVSV